MHDSAHLENGAPAPAEMPNRVRDDTDTRQELGRRLREARDRRGLKQSEVAEHFQVGKQTVSAWETGYGLPDPLRLARLAHHYEVSVESLLQGLHEWERGAVAR